MRRWILLLLVAGSCARSSERVPEFYDRALEGLERGDLQGAEALVVEHEPSFRGQPRSPWHWRFRLLHAEVLIAQGKAGDAIALVDSPVVVDDVEDAKALEARRLKVRGHASLNLGRYDDATRLLEEAADKARTAAVARLGLELDVLRGLLFIRTNRQSEGEAVTRAAYARAVEQSDAYWQAAAANNLGLERMRAFRYDEAIPFLEQALTAADSVQARRFSAASLANLGTCYYRVGDFDKALSFLQKAAEIQEQIGALAGLQSSLGDIGGVHFMQGRADRAIEFFDRALSLARSNAPWDSAKWAGNLAAAHAELKQWDEAERFNRESFKLQQETNDANSAAYARFDAASIAAGRHQHDRAIALYEETLALARDNAELTWEANAGLAAAHTALGQTARATVFFQRSLQTIDAARTRLSRTDYKLTFLSRLIRFYQMYVDVLVGRGDVDRALQVADSSRALLLSERLELGRDGRAPVNRATLQQAAKRLHVVFLSYWLAPERSFLWVGTGETFKLFELPAADRIAGLVDAYRRFIETSMRDPIASNFAPARELYDVLIGPARSLIPPGSQVVIVPDGALHALNVETLPNMAASPPRYFIDEVAVSVAPSLGLMLAAAAPTASASPALLLIGDPEPAAPDFPRLADAGRELDAIRRRFATAETTLLAGSRANPAAYQAARPERFTLIHFAAHATANRASPLDSAVVLSPHTDGYLLSARDVLNVPLRADLVTISACRSAGATVYGGEGIVGFVWAFLQSGAKSVIAGLWDVSDRSTFQMMDSLYSGLQAGASPAVALRNAKLALIRGGKNFANPYYWGPFQIYVGGAPRGRTVTHTS
jgi:CHAT domain-containing protein/Tfp pilus assembly protein PilF